MIRNKNAYNIRPPFFYSVIHDSNMESSFFMIVAFIFIFKKRVNDLSYTDRGSSRKTCVKNHVC